MKMTALSGAVIALVLTAVPMATAASAAQIPASSAAVSSASNTPSVAGAAARRCGQDQYGRYTYLCTHHGFHRSRGNHQRRLGNGRRFHGDVAVG